MDLFEIFHIILSNFIDFRYRIFFTVLKKILLRIRIFLYFYLSLFFLILIKNIKNRKILFNFTILRFYD